MLFLLYIYLRIFPFTHLYSLLVGDLLYIFIWRWTHDFFLYYFLITSHLCCCQMKFRAIFSLVQFSCSVMSDFLRPHGLQHTRLPCPSATPRACSNSCPSSRWCILYRPLLLLPSIFPSTRVFSNELDLHLRWSNYWSFSISPSIEYSGLISFRMNWLDLLAVQGTLKSLSSTTV